jgi:DNA-binding GntR family transcriptional regulator
MYTKAPPTDRITTELRRRILSGELPAGLQLRQERLASQFGVSRIPLREALSRLEAEGLVTREHNRGCVVASLSLDDLEESLEIRSALETRALRLAIPRMTAADFAALARILGRYARTASPARWSELNLDFHLALYRPCALPRLVGMIEQQIRGTDRYLRVYVSSVVGRDDPLAEHHEIVEACREGRTTRAVRLLEKHIERTRRALRANAVA